MTTTGVEPHARGAVRDRVITTLMRIADELLCSSSKKMGLYVARKITDLLGGTIGVSSLVGVGSTFQVWVPAVDLAAGTEAQPARLETMRPPNIQERL